MPGLPVAVVAPPALRHALLPLRHSGARYHHRHCAHVPLLLGGRSRQNALFRPASLQGQRRSASTVFNVKARAGETSGEQTLFIVGLNEGKFFGQDSCEEALKLLERIHDHHGSSYQLLFGLRDRELIEIENDHKVKNQRLTPSRDLERARNSEFIPVAQAGMVDKCPRRALGRDLKITQSHVSWQLWKHPRECVKLYWAFWQRKRHKNAACRSFWSQHFPISAYPYFDECAELIAIRAVEQLVGSQRQGKTGTFVLVVRNELYELIVDRIGLILDGAPEKLHTSDFSRHMRDRATDLCAEIPDLQPLLVFVYGAIPLLVLQYVALGVEQMVEDYGVLEQVLPTERRE